MCGRKSAWKKLTENASHMTKDTFSKLTPFLRTARYAVLHGFGESLLHPHFLWMVRMCKSNGCMVDFHTNGLSLTEDVSEELVSSDLDHITISIDAATAETYKAIRGEDFKRILFNLERLNFIKIKYKKNYPKIKLKYILMNKNVDEIPLLIDLAAQYQVSQIDLFNLVVWPEQIELRQQVLFDQPLSVMGVYSDALEKARSYGIGMTYLGLEPKESPVSCPFTNFTVFCDGSVGPCGAQKFILGNVNLTPLKEIWNNSKYQQLRKQFHGSEFPYRCKRCYARTNASADYLEPDMSYVEETLQLRRWDMCEK